MRIQVHPDTVVVWASANDTYEWAHRSGAYWPCSTLSGHRIVAAFDCNGLADVAIDGRSDRDCDTHELNALLADLVGRRLPADHPCHFIIVGQFSAVRNRHPHI